MSHWTKNLPEYNGPDYGFAIQEKQRRVAEMEALLASARAELQRIEDEAMSTAKKSWSDSEIASAKRGETLTLTY